MTNTDLRILKEKRKREIEEGGRWGKALTVGEGRGRIWAIMYGDMGTLLGHIPEGYVKVEESGFLRDILEPYMGWLYVESSAWTVIGFLGAGIFGSRFILQWLTSEKKKKLVVPWYFWHLSFWGSSLNMLYFMHVDKAPLILGNCFLPFLYARNLVLLHRGKHSTLQTEEVDGGDDEVSFDAQENGEGQDG